MKLKGFTLIELVIVIATIGIIASAVVLSIGGQTDVAENAVDTAEASSLRTVALFYEAANAGSYQDICRNKISKTPAFYSLGEGIRPRRCLDRDDTWVVFWRVRGKDGKYFSCIGEKGSKAVYESPFGFTLRQTAQNLTLSIAPCTDLLSRLTPSERTDLESDLLTHFFKITDFLQ